MVTFILRAFRKYLNAGVPEVCFEVSVIISVSLVFYSCALYSPSSSDRIVVKTCAIPADQAGTISGHWTTSPIPIAFHQGDFTAAEMLLMTSAADTWNNFFTASQGHTVLTYGGSATSPLLSTSADASQGGSLCSHGILQAGTFNGNIVVYKLGTWPYAASAIALTSFCTLPTKPYGSFYMAVMEVNYQNFFTPGTAKYPDLQSIMLHEFGHVLGLNHSCEGTTKPGTPQCTSAGLNPDYALASMFPSFGFDQTGAGQVKQILGTNDQSRANCLYSPTPSASATPTPTH